MSPNVSSFVGDLVEMAKAFERLPTLERELEKAHDDIESYAKSLQAREIHIIDLKKQIDDLNTKLNSSEVARDDAEYRFLEADDRAASVLNSLRSLQTALGAAVTQLDQPKPEVKPEPTPSLEPMPLPEQGQSASPSPSDVSSSTQPLGAIGSQSSASPNPGQSAPDPIVNQTHSATSETALGHVESKESVGSGHSGQSEPLPSSVTGGEVQHTAFAENAGPTDTAIGTTILDHKQDKAETSPLPFPYLDKRYIDVPGFISRSEWLTGGGTNENYDWREGGSIEYRDPPRS